MWRRDLGRPSPDRQPAALSARTRWRPTSVATAFAHHASLWELGLLPGIYDLAEIVLKPVFGSLSDRIGPRPVLLGGLVAFVLASAVFVVAGHPQGLGAARLAQGAAAAAFSPAAGAALASLGVEKRIGRLFGGYGGAKSLGYLAGPLLGGALVAAGGYGLLFVILAAFAAAVCSGCPAAAPDRFGAASPVDAGRSRPLRHPPPLPAPGGAARPRHRRGCRPASATCPCSASVTTSAPLRRAR